MSESVGLRLGKHFGGTTQIVCVDAQIASEHACMQVILGLSLTVFMVTNTYTDALARPQKVDNLHFGELLVGLFSACIFCNLSLVQRSEQNTHFL